MNSFKPFITNDEVKLSEFIKSISKEVENCYFLVGFFYFSGFKEIYKELIDKNIKVLVGLEIEKNIGNIFAEVYKLKQEKNLSDKVIREKFIDSFKDFVNSSDYFDSYENQEAFYIFLEKIKNGTLEIRKTRKPTHSKMYLFERKEKNLGFSPGFLIIGSSNLTYSGLTGQNEISVLLHDAVYYNGAKQLFDEMWENSVPIVSEDNFEEFKKHFVEKTWISVVPSPQLLYIRALHEYFEAQKLKVEFLPSQITENKFYDLKYQLDAIERAISILNQHNGVIIADVVGLGKTVIASAIAHVLRIRTVVIAPPHLVENWQAYRFDFDFQGRVFSSGKLEEALDFVISDESEKLIIVDEAHRYRNENTQSYATLHKICQGNKVVLLSATPFNNRPSDIFSLLKLFQAPTTSTFVNKKQGDLQSIFKKFNEDFLNAERNGDKRKIEEISSKIRDIISPVVIRRTRLDLREIEVYRKDLKAQGVMFPEVEEPKLMSYDLGEITGLYLKTLEKICPYDEKPKFKYFKATRYKPTAYLKNFEKYRKPLTELFGTENFERSQENIANFMRKLLVYRFESSIYAFRISLEHMIVATERMIKWYKSGQIPIYKKGAIPDPEEVFNEGTYEEDEIPDESREALDKLREKGYYFIDSREIRKSFVEDLQSDVELLKEIYDEWFGNRDLQDQKLIHFKSNLRKLFREKPGRKIVVFSEFADTVNYLHEKLKDEFPAVKYTSKDSTKANREIIRKEFDASYHSQTNDFKLLIATDAISEGFNLNRADVIFNYDIPYNPTRVIQRVGRINRIGKRVQEKIYIYNYFPTVIGEDETSVRKITTAKIHMFNFILGTDTKILTTDESINSYFAKEIRELEKQESSWDVEYLNDLNDIKTNKPEIYEEALNLPKRVRTKILNAEFNGTLIFTRKNHLLNFELVKEDELFNISAREGLNYFKSMCSHKYDKVDKKLEEYLKLFRNRKPTDSVRLSRAEREFLSGVEYLISRNFDEKNYLDDLRKVIKSLMLPKYLVRQGNDLIKGILQEKTGFEKLKKLIPHEYVKRMISKFTNENREDAEIILIEEFSEESE